MTEPLTVTELDERTKDELQPPCELTRGPGSARVCDAPAAWAVASICDRCAVPRTRLLCDPHALERINGCLLICRVCTPADVAERPARIISAVRL